MSRELSTPATEALTAPYTDEQIVVLVEITHADLAAPIRVVNDTQDLDVDGDTYSACPMRIRLPGEREDQIPAAQLVIDNVDRSIVAALPQVIDPPTVTFTVVLRSSPTTAEAGPFTFALRVVSYDVLVIESTLGVPPILDEPLLGDRFTPKDYPGLHR